MTPADVRTMQDHEIVEFLVELKPSDAAFAWLALVIADPAKIASVAELSRRYVAQTEGRVRLPRARSAGTVLIDGAKFKHLMWVNRIPMNQVGPMIGKCEGWGSVIAHKGRMSFWAADALSTELGMHVDAFIEAVAAPEELSRLGVA